jgi:hypothetical protein
MGKSGRAIIEALMAGETNTTKLASLADRRVKASQEEFRETLRGRVRKQHRFLLRLHLNQIDSLAAAIATIDAQVEANLGPFGTAVEQVVSIPGIKDLGANSGGGCGAISDQSLPCLSSSSFAPGSSFATSAPSTCLRALRISESFPPYRRNRVVDVLTNHLITLAGQFFEAAAVKNCDFAAMVLY